MSSTTISIKARTEYSSGQNNGTNTVKNREKVLSLLEQRGVRSAASLEKKTGTNPLNLPAGWHLSELSGRLVELSSPLDAASSALTLSLGLVAQAQRSREPACWVTATPDSFFPPDAVHAGVDLSSLPVIRIAQDECAVSPKTNRKGRQRASNSEKKKSILKKTLRAVEMVARSGAFALIIIDMGKMNHLPAHALSRLKGLVHKHGTALLFLTQKSTQAPSLDSLISLRGVARRERASTLERSYSLSCRLFR